jgi:head-tail adaptor
MPMARAHVGAGSMTEQITLLSSTPVPVSVTSITRVNQTATVTAAAAHGFTSGDYVSHAGAVQTEYNVEAQVTVTSPTVYTYEVSGTPATPATGTITTTYISNSSGGSGSPFYTLASGIWANIVPFSANEQLAAGGISAIGSYVATIYYRADVSPTMRVSWRKYLEATAKTYEIHSVQPSKEDPRRMLDLEIGVVEA